MSRRDQLVIQFILWLAIGTFLFGIWAFVVGVHKSSPPPPTSADALKNGHSTTGSTN